MSRQSLKIPAAEDGQRLDRWLKRRFPAVPFLGIQKALRQGRVQVNGRKAKMDARLSAQDEVGIPADFLAGKRQEGQGAFVATQADKAMVAAAVVYEDRQLLVLNKPQGLPAQAGGGQVRSLDRVLAAVYGAEKAPKLVHRLDRETTGLIVCGKTRTAAAALSTQWAGREVTKAYLAVVLGAGLAAKGRMRDPIAKVGPQAVIRPDGDAAETVWVRLAEGQPAGLDHPVTLVLAWPKTGRMNQIRIHFAHHGWPLVGDDKYGLAPAKVAGKVLGTGLALHAWRLKLAHPATAEPLELTAPPPPAWAGLLTSGSDSLGRAEEAWQAWCK